MTLLVNFKLDIYSKVLYNLRSIKLTEGVAVPWWVNFEPLEVLLWVD